MKPSLVLQSHREDVRRVVAANHATHPRVFGSVLHGNDSHDSDLDLLVDPEPGMTLMDVAAIQVELEALLGIAVDVLTPKALPESFRGQVLAEAMPV